jgi:hypothetical protein
METFSVLESFYLAWGIYKKVFFKMTAGIAAVYVFFALICFLTWFLFYQNMPVAAALLIPIYCFLMMLYMSFARGFFNGKGMSFKNFFPPLKQIFLLAGFTLFINGFLVAMFFITEKVSAILNLFLYKSIKNPEIIMFFVVLVFTVLAFYVIVVLFYAPLSILDGVKFSDSLAASLEIIQSHKIAFFCVLSVLACLNFIGHITLFGWLFTLPFSVLVILQIYITISKKSGDITDEEYY